MIVLLDTGPLGLITNPNQKNVETIQCEEWIRELVKKRVVICVPEIAYYESRRKHVHLKNEKALNRLESFLNHPRISYAPITTEIIKKASDLWGWARSTGQSTAHEKSIDSDVILAATAIIMSSRPEYVVIATTNVKHLARYTPAQEWKQITL